MRVEGRSTSPDAAPSWLQSAASFDLVAISGSTIVIFEAKTLAEAAPTLVGQRQFFESVDPDDSAFGLMQQTLRGAAEERSDSDLFDQPLLSTFRRFEHLLRSGFSSIEFANEDPIVVDEAAIAAVDRLIRSTPQPQRTRVAGTLDTIRHSDRMFTLILEDGQAIKGIAEEGAAEQLAALLGKSVVVSGTAVFRPSGTLLRIEADVIEPAGPDAAVWSRVPSPLFRIMDVATLRQPQEPRSGVNAIIGHWPGDETDEEISAALRELS